MSNRKKPLKPWLKEFFGLEEIEKLDVPKDEKVVIKVVPAKVDGEVVGETYIYDDGTVDIFLKDDISHEAMEKLRLTADEAGYSIGGTIGDTISGRIY